MVGDSRACGSPVAKLVVKVKKTDATRVRRALTLKEVVRLLVVARNSTRPAKMTGLARSLAYRLAIEVSLRRGDFNHLKVASFDFEQCAVSLTKGTKSGKPKVLPLRADTAAELRAYMVNRLPGAPAFDMPTKTATMLREDLEEAGLFYVNDLGQVADFHALRHTSGTWLGFAGTHPNVIKEIMRHSDIRLTMDRYGHLFDGESRKAVESLPNLSEAMRATGTDDKPTEPLGVKLGVSACQTMPSMPSMRLGAQNEAPAMKTREASESALTGQKPRFQADNRRGRDSNPG